MDEITLHSLAMNSLTKQSWQRVKDYIISRDKYLCQYCGEFDTEGAPDHILPLTRGGTDAVHNLVWSCKTCNSSKGNKTVREWTQWLASEERKTLQVSIQKFLNASDRYVKQMKQFIPNSLDVENTRHLVFGLLSCLEALLISILILRKMWLKGGVPKEKVIELEKGYFTTSSLISILNSESKLVASGLDIDKLHFTESVLEFVASELKRPFNPSNRTSGLNGNGHNGHQFSFLD